MKTQFNDFEEFNNYVGLLKTSEVPSQLKQFISEDFDDEQAAQFDLNALEHLINFVALNPQYHIATGTTDFDDVKDGRESITNFVRFVNREHFFLCNGSKDENAFLLVVEKE